MIIFKFFCGATLEILARNFVIFQLMYDVNCDFLLLAKPIMDCNYFA